ncbi:Gfo/Idh/MocA family protein [Nocardioides insulae]|uniref:Gfo/Idh/MocA family protein n=1 Tax=Nocardioides insulae TaxID=394734 RepID=UPI0004200E0C|nr:Gfo/Idh/MocA family oxidoreductase [Nocardioides insulae]
MTEARSRRTVAGIIGTGFMGEVHARAIRRSGAELRRVVGSTPERSREAGERLGLDRFTDDLATLLADPEIDVVHVCTPNATHAEFVRAILDAGKHVICEKPLAVTADEADDLTRRADAAGLVATVPFVYRFYPMVREARARLASGASGEVRLLHGSYLQDWLAQTDDDNWRVSAEHGGASRAFADIGVHWCDLLEFVTGHRITRVTARTLIAMPERAGRPVTTEDAAVLLLETDRGATGTLTVSQISPGRKNRLWFSVDAARESLSFDQENPDSLWVGGRDVNQQLLRGARPAAGAASYDVLPAGHPQGYQDCFDAFVRDTYAALRGGKPDGLPTFADGLRAARITAAVIESAATGTWVDIDELHTPEQELIA